VGWERWLPAEPFWAWPVGCLPLFYFVLKLFPFIIFPVFFQSHFEIVLDQKLSREKRIINWNKKRRIVLAIK
jgi:hypothetical protein